MNEKVSIPTNAPVYYANGFGIAMSQRDIAIALLDGEPDFFGNSKKVEQKHRATLKISHKTGIALASQLLEAFSKEPEMKKSLLEVIKKLSLS